jgi:hypothetical protein
MRYINLNCITLNYINRIFYEIYKLYDYYSDIRDDVRRNYRELLKYNNLHHLNYYGPEYLKSDVALTFSPVPTRWGLELIHDRFLCIFCDTRKLSNEEMRIQREYGKTIEKIRNILNIKHCDKSIILSDIICILMQTC